MSSPSILTVSMKKAVWTLAWPTIVLGLLRSGYFLVNAFWVAGMGREALAAIGGAAFAIWTVYALTELSATGVYSLVAQSVGAHEPARARRVLGHGLVLALLVGLAVGVLLYLSRGLYFTLLGESNEDVRRLGMAYLGISAFGTVPLVLFNTLTSAFRAIGDARTPMWIFGVTLLFNVVVDPVLIYGMGEWPGMGIGGAALATALASLLGAVLSLRGLIRSGYRPSFGGIDPSRLLEIASIGLPIAASGTGFDLVYVFLGREINRFGPAAMAAVGLGHRIESLGYLASIGFQVAATTLVGQWVGAGHPERAAEAARHVQREMLRLLLPVSLFVIVFAPLLIRPFSGDPEVLSYGAWYLRINGMVMCLMGLEVMYEGAFAGAGRTLPALLIAFPLTAIRIPLSYLLAVTFGMGPVGIWCAIALSTAIKGILMKLWFGRGGWRRKAQPITATG